MMEEKLPEGWVWTTFNDLILFSQNGCNKRRSDEGLATVVLRLSDINNGMVSLANTRKIELTDREIESYKLLTNDLLCIRVNGSRDLVGRIIKFSETSDEPIAFCDHFIRFRLTTLSVATFISYYFETDLARRHIDLHMVCTAGQNTVSQGSVTSVVVPLPPLPEQNRIVAAIEQQFTRLDNAVASLKSARERTKQYRASLLKSAVEGDLTKEWRVEHPASETGAQLLERILAERRARWEEEQLAKMGDRGTLFKGDSWKKKYKEPQGPDIEKLPALPEGWCWATVEQLSTKVVDGTHHTPTYTSEGIPFISVKDIQNGQIQFNDCKYISQVEHGELIQRCHPEYSDVLITKSGTIGRVAIVETERDFSLFVSVALIKTLKKAFIQKYFKIALEYYILSINIQQDIKGGVIKNFHLEDLRLVPLKIPSFAEQEQIVNAFEERITNIEQLEKTTEASFKRAEQERQSILQEAFAGRLVEQDPDDEPASVLLERIREERKKREEAEIIVKGSRKGSRMGSIKKRPGLRTANGQPEIGLYQKLAEAGKPLAPEELFKQVGLKPDDQPESTEVFYEELDVDVEDKLIRETRPAYNYVELEALEASPDLLARVEEEEAGTESPAPPQQVKSARKAEQGAEAAQAHTLWDA